MAMSIAHPVLHDPCALSLLRVRSFRPLRRASALACRSAQALPTSGTSFISDTPSGGGGPSRKNLSGTDATTSVPRLCTLQELAFSEDGRVGARSVPPAGAAVAAVNFAAVDSQGQSRPFGFVDALQAFVEATARVNDLETLSGRVAMVAFFCAIALEFFTGSGLFSSITPDDLGHLLGLCLLSVLGAGTFAVARSGSARATATGMLSSSCKQIVDLAIDSILVDALFFDDGLEVTPHSSEVIRK